MTGLTYYLSIFVITKVQYPILTRRDQSIPWHLQFGNFLFKGDWLLGQINLSHHELVHRQLLLFALEADFRNQCQWIFGWKTSSVWRLSFQLGCLCSWAIQPVFVTRPAFSVDYRAWSSMLVADFATARASPRFSDWMASTFRLWFTYLRCRFSYYSVQ